MGLRPWTVLWTVGSFHRPGNRPGAPILVDGSGRSGRFKSATVQRTVQAVQASVQERPFWWTGQDGLDGSKVQPSREPSRPFLVCLQQDMEWSGRSGRFFSQFTQPF